MTKWQDIGSSERDDWLRNEATQAFLGLLTELGQSFQRDSLSRARKNEPGAYEAGKADAMEDAISIARGER